MNNRSIIRVVYIENNHILFMKSINNHNYSIYDYSGLFIDDEELSLAGSTKYKLVFIIPELNNVMKLLLDFEPCNESREMMNELGSEEMLFADDEKRADASAKFLRHLTYNHNEVVKAVMSEVKTQKRSPEFDLYK